jgi:tetrahydromethanopterin S-methyltransferase subunit D
MHNSLSLKLSGAMFAFVSTLGMLAGSAHAAADPGVTAIATDGIAALKDNALAIIPGAVAAAVVIFVALKAWPLVRKVVRL